MAKEFKIRWGYEKDFEVIKLAPRELGCAIDTNKLFLGTTDGNIHIPNEKYTNSMIKTALDLFTIASGTATELSGESFKEKLAYNTTIKRIQYQDRDGAVHRLLFPEDLMLSRPISVQLTEENIDLEDNNSVIINGFDRPFIMVYVNGVLATDHASDPHQLTIDTENKTLKIIGCAAGDIISYY